MTGRSVQTSLPFSTRLAHLFAVPVGVALCTLAAAKSGSSPAWILPTIAAAAIPFASARRLLGRAPTHTPTPPVDDQLIQTHKFAALGQISSGIAHEINTPLAIIGQEAEWMEHLLNQAHPLDSIIPGLRHSLVQIAAQIDRCRTITHSMLQFARKSGAVPQPTNLNTLVEGMALLVEKEAKGRGIRLVRSYDSTLPHIPTDPQLVRQVVLNILNNAVQAVDRRGSVFLSTSFSSSHAAVEISDTGPGIPNDAMASIFDPFFTTKPPDQGTGLGLSICQGIVTRLGGTISATNKASGGAVLTVRLPLKGQQAPPASGHNLCEAQHEHEAH